jgi:NOL1/NOP2/fmu family ribosome biogenesis protein
MAEGRRWREQVEVVVAQSRNAHAIELERNQERQNLAGKEAVDLF